MWLISVGGCRVSRELAAKYRLWAEENESRIIWVLLGVPERFNIALFEDMTMSDAERVAGLRAKALQDDLGLRESEVMAWQVACDAVNYKFQLGRLYDQFKSNRRFERHCLSQTFSNLQPRFRRLGVQKKTSEEVRVAAHYLLEELALKIGVYEAGPFDGEIVPFGEMDLTRKIYAGSYFSCSCRPSGFAIVSGSADGIDVERWGERS